jgi:formylglycine-generating enzyme required for sulfatase activity
MTRVRCPRGPDMARIVGGTFRMRSDTHYSEERPVHNVRVDGFWIDRRAVTNAEFATLVDGKLVSTEKLERTLPLVLPLDQTFNIGSAGATPVDRDYKVH